MTMSTSRYAMNFGTIALEGAALVDRTTHLFEIEHPDHDPLTLVIWRTPIPEDKSLRQLVTARVADEMVRLPGYKILSDADVEFEGTLARDVASRWRDDDRVIYGRQAHLAVDEVWVAFALSGPLESRAACDAWFDEIMTSFSPREAD